MERLTTRNIAGVAVYKYPFECERCGETIWRLPDYGNGSPTEKLAAYEDAEEHGQYGKWIPVSERLPEELVPVNVTWINRNPESYYAKIKDVPFSATAVYYNSKWYWYSSTCVDYLSEYGENDFDLVDKDIDVIAWQPLPQPYQPKGE